MIKSKGQHGGAREGSGRPRKFVKVKTKVVRVPESVDVEVLVALADDLRTLVDSWRAEANEPAHRSSPRYDGLRRAIDDVSRLLEVVADAET